MVLNGGRCAAVGAHILFKVGKLLLRRAAADEDKARVFVLGGGHTAPAAGLGLGGTGRAACPLPRAERAATAVCLRLAAGLCIPGLVLAAALVLGRAGTAVIPVIPLIAAAAGIAVTAAVVLALGTVIALHRGGGLGGRGGILVLIQILLGRAERSRLRGADKVGVKLGLCVAAAARGLRGAALTAAVLRAAGLVTGSYHAGCEPLSARIRVNGEPVAPELLAQAAETLSARETLPRAAAELAAAARCFGEAGCALAVVELPDAGLAEALPKMPVCAVTSIGPDGISASLERSAALAAGVMRKGSICVTAPEQPKAVVSELIVAAGKADCELVVPDPDDITFLEAEKFASRVDYGGYTVPLAFLGRHAAGSAAIAVELALALCKKGYDIPGGLKQKMQQKLSQTYPFFLNGNLRFLLLLSICLKSLY